MNYTTKANEQHLVTHNKTDYKYRIIQKGNY